jgi:hypothetical protein
MRDKNSCFILQHRRQNHDFLQILESQPQNHNLQVSPIIP